MADTETGSTPDISGLTRILDTLVPQKTVLVLDSLGNEYKLPGSLPARRQIEVLRRLEALKNAAMEDPAVQALIGSFRKGKATEEVDGGEAMSSVIDTIVKLANDPEVLDSLSNAFAFAHPGVVAKAKVALAEVEGEAGEDPADLFPLEELVAGLVPFFVRLLKRGAEALGAFTQASQTMAATEKESR